MRRIVSFLLWAVVFLLIVLALDQLLVRVPATAPAHVAVAGFYRDLRGRLFDLARGMRPVPPPAQPATPDKGKGSPPRLPASVETVIEQHQAGTTSSAGLAARPPAAVGAKPRYVYADAQGAIHFAETLAEVPEEYRAGARLLAE